MVNQFFQLRESLPDEHLRAQVNDHFLRQINERSSQDERKAILRDLKLEGREGVVLIDASRDNKTSGSKT
ncbi:hypothetical protein ABRZ03_05025 [Castellaniella ginsengisoli]